MDDGGGPILRDSRGRRRHDPGPDVRDETGAQEDHLRRQRSARAEDAPDLDQVVRGDAPVGQAEGRGEARQYLRTMVSRRSACQGWWRTCSPSPAMAAEPRALEPLDLAELARETALQMNPGLSDNGFTCSFSADGPGLVLGDPGALRQVVMNLLSNAEKYSGQGREIQVRCVRDRGQAVVEVMDRGPGVAQLQRGRCFRSSSGETTRSRLRRAARGLDCT